MSFGLWQVCALGCPVPAIDTASGLCEGKIPHRESFMEIAVDNAPGTVVVRETGRGLYQQEVISGPHHLLADEPENVGGLDSGPGPYELLLAALGACTTMTLRLYADRNQIPLKHSQISLRHARIYARKRLFGLRNEGGNDRSN